MVKYLILVFASVSIVLLLLSYSYYICLQPLSPASSVRPFVINQGDGLQSISQRLEKEKIIKNRFAFIIYSRLSGTSSKLQAGRFQLSPSMAIPEISSNLSHGGNFDYQVTLIEGQRVEEIARYLETRLENFNREKFIILAKSYEGQLFPDTYSIPTNYSEKSVIDLFRRHYQLKFEQASAGSTSPLPSNDTLVVASLLEREGRSADSKAAISGIIYNRLAANMPLQIDATVQYARDSKNPAPSQFWLPLAKSDLAIPSIYNTYLQPKLPPQPICNPGYDSLYAAHHPLSSDYYFYLTGLDGQMHYARTFEEHKENIKRYLNQQSVFHLLKNLLMVSI